MRIEDQWDTYFLGWVCMHSFHQADRVITDASVAVFSRSSVSNISVVILSFFVILIMVCQAMPPVATPVV